MQKLKLSWNIHLGGADEKSKLDEPRSSCIGVFVAAIEIPFHPYIGLRISKGRFHTPPIESITYDVEESVFHCIFKEDRSLPIGAASVLGAKNVDWPPSSIIEYIDSSKKWRIEELEKHGWTLAGYI